MTWIRTCQECMKEHKTKKPNLNDPKENWRDYKCRRCGSMALSFGHEQTNNELELDD